MKVVATDAFQKLRLKLKEVNRIPAPGEVLDVSEDRYVFLHATNKYNLSFVNKLDEVSIPVEAEAPIIEEPEVIVIKPKKTKKKEATKVED